jgi:hypothetical protein
MAWPFASQEEWIAGLKLSFSTSKNEYISSLELECSPSCGVEYLPSFEVECLPSFEMECLPS